MKEIIKEYSNGEITVIWKPSLCIHCGICAKEMPQVFQPTQRPWVKIQNGNTQALKAQVDRCPSNALSYRMESINNDIEKSRNMTNTNIEIIPKGPIIIKGTVSIKHSDGSEEIKENRCSLCRCGASSNKPYCDGTHKTVDFE